MTLVKICGLKVPEIAYSTAKEGADFIGIVRCPASPRHVELDLAGQIAQAALEGGARPVLVYRREKKEVIEEESRQLGISIVQVHEQPQELDPHLTLIYACTIPKFFRKDVDYFMLDSPEPGKGKRLDWRIIQVPNFLKWILAGGLNPNNVRQAIRLLNPHGVDVSTGVESEGEKNIDLIKQFIHEVKSYA